jgi:alginate O-acetyltransferase complex protein AlgI
MLFNSFTFLLFLPLVVFVYYILPGNGAKRIFLTLASIVFVLSANFLSLIVISTIAVANYFLAIQISENKKKNTTKIFFMIAVMINIGNLFFFKYYDFFNENLSSALGIINLKNPLPFVHVFLPLGISFYTFAVLGYLIDIRISTIKAEKNFFAFVNYVFFFPKLLAGPIDRSQTFLPQSHETKTVQWENFSIGGKLIIWGFFQKLVIADRIGIYVDAIYGNVALHSGITIMVCLILYTFQIYADFSGYTDIARGISRVLGYDLMVNFRRPFLASSITEFWRRWHISLSSWVNDYIFTPLSLKYRSLGIMGVILSLFISFLIVGIWHGALWTFVLFGCLQGIILTLELFTLRKRRKLFKHFPKYLVHFIGVIITFIITVFSLVLFRAPSFKTAILVYGRLTTSGDFFVGELATFIYAIIGIAIILIHDIVKEYFERDILTIRSKYFVIRSFSYATLIMLILMLGVFDGGQFIYFQF